MMLIGFVSAHAKDILIKFVTVFAVGILLALLLGWLTPYQIDASQGFVRAVLNSITAGRLEAALIFGFMLGFIFATAPLFLSAMRKISKAIDAGTFDRLNVKVSPLYVAVLVTAVASYALYLAGVVVRQTILQGSLFGYLFAYQVFTSIFFLSVCDLAIALKLRSRAGVSKAVE